jgi:hypothetical protein
VTERATCPRCRRPVEASWRYCPHCTAPVQEKPPGAPFRIQLPGEPTAERDVRFDTGWIGIGLIALGGLGFLGVFSAILNGSLSNMDTWFSTLAGCALVVVIGMVFGFTSRQQSTRMAAGIAGSVMITFMVVGAPLVMFLALLIAIVTCGQGLGR